MANSIDMLKLENDQLHSDKLHLEMENEKLRDKMDRMKKKME